MQQYRELRRRGTPSPDPRRCFLPDLASHILQLRSETHGILLGMDANLTRPDPDFSTFLHKSGLHDILALKHPHPTGTHTKGNCLDLILGCDFVLQHTASVGILSSQYGAELDHRLPLALSFLSVWDQRRSYLPYSTWLLDQ